METSVDTPVKSNLEQIHEPNVSHGEQVLYDLLFDEKEEVDNNVTKNGKIEEKFFLTFLNSLLYQII